MRLLPLFITVKDPIHYTIHVTVIQKRRGKVRFKPLRYTYYGVRKGYALYRLDKRTVPRRMRQGIVENFDLRVGEFCENLSFNNKYLALYQGYH